MGLRGDDSIDASPPFKTPPHTGKPSVWRFFFALWCPVVSIKSHRNRTDHFFFHNAKFRLGLPVVVPDEFAVGAEDHLHILMPQLAGHVRWIGAGRQQGLGIGVTDLV